MVSMVSVSLSAWDQIQESQKTSRKRMWALFLSLASMLAIYQSADVFSSFFELSVSESETIKLNKSDFVVTVCLGNRLFYYKNDDVVHEILLKMKSLSPTCNMTSPSLFCLSLLTDRERYYISHDLYENVYPIPDTDFFSDSIKVRVFNNLYYGNCVTREADINDPMYLTTIKILSETNPPVFVVHARGTPPVFLPNNINVIKAKNIEVLVDYLSVDYNDLAWPYNRVCEDGPRTIQSWTNLNVADDYDSSTYSFSMESCLDQCVNDLTLAYCKCIIPHSMLKRNEHKFPICLRICNKIPQREFDVLCNCKTPCHSVEYKVQSGWFDPYQFEQSRLADAITWKDSGRDYVEGEYDFEGEDDVAYVFETLKSEFLGNLFSDLIFHKSYILKTKLKTPLLKLEDVYSVIGGIWGLWIGLSCSILFSMLIEAILKPAALVKSCDKFINYLINAFKYFGLIAIAAVYIYQSYIIIQLFYQFDVINVETTELQNSSSFPPVYVCPGTSVYLKNLDATKNVHYSKNMKDLIQFYKTSEDYTKRYLKLGNFKYEERVLFVPTVEEFVLECEFSTETGSKIPCEFESFPYIINVNAKVCAIIHPRKSIKDDKLIRLTDLKLRLAFPRDSFSGYELKTSVGLQPFLIFKSDKNFDNAFWNAFDVEPGDLVNVTYTLTETKRLPVPYTSKCIDENTKYLDRNSVMDRFYRTLKYHYTYLNCLRLCLETDWAHSVDIELKDAESCQCQLPCNENRYELEVNQEKYVSKQRPKKNEFKSFKALTNYLWNGTAEVHISRKFPTKKVISEKPVIDSFSVVGMIGGISGLWLGQSIISLMVELHLMLTVVAASLKTKLIQS